VPPRSSQERLTQPVRYVKAFLRQDTNVIARIWKLSRRRFAKEAADYLVGVPERFRIDPEVLGERAARAIAASLYRSVRIHAEHGMGTVEATTGGGHVNRFAFLAEEFEAGLDTSGIGIYLRMNARAGHALRRDIPRRIRESANTRVLLWESRDAGSGRAEC